MSKLAESIEGLKFVLASVPHLVRGHSGGAVAHKVVFELGVLELIFSEWER